MQRAELGTYMEQRVVDPFVADLGVHEESDGVDLVAVEPDGALLCELNRPLILPDYE